MKYLIILSLAFFAACNPIEKRGYSFELSDHKFLKEDVHNKKDVLLLMGHPSFVSDVNQKELWVYYSEDVKKVLFFKPDILSRKIVTVSFNDKDVVKRIENYDLQDQNSVEFNKNYTAVASPKKSWWSEIFGNIGQVKAN